MNTPVRRLFFALWPDDALRIRLVQMTGPAVRLAGGRPVPPANYHLTLAFLGELPAGRLDAIIEAAAAVPLPAFDFRLDRYGGFRRAGVFWLGPAETPPALTTLVASLWQSLAPLGLVSTGPFRAHLTLCRKVQSEITLPPPHPVSWAVREFVLAESVPAGGGHGVRYEVLARFPGAPAMPVCISANAPDSSAAPPGEL